MASQTMRITLKAYDHALVDSSARKIIDTVKKILCTDITRHYEYGVLEIDRTTL